LNDFYVGREQTKTKHFILQRYLSALGTIVGSRYKDFAYIDCLAGPWESRDPGLSDTSFGTAVSVLRQVRSTLAARAIKPALRCLFIEEVPDRFTRLREFAESVKDLECVAQNWNFTKHVSDVVKFAKRERSSFPFFFIDPTGWEQLQTEIIRPILEVEPGEVLINLMTSWMSRFLSDETKNWHLVIGNAANDISKLTGTAREDGLVAAFSETIRFAGNFPYVCTLPVLSGDKNTFHFYMVYATRSEKGVEEFKNAERKVLDFMTSEWEIAQERIRLERTGQPLLIPGAFERESRITEFRLRNQKLAKAAVRCALQSRIDVSYDELWASAMQFSTVMQSDLRTWLREWREQGDVLYPNLLPGKKLPQRKQQHLVRWNGKTN
jgi:three-Cys-motif partner protein